MFCGLKCVTSTTLCCETAELEFYFTHVTTTSLHPHSTVKTCQITVDGYWLSVVHDNTFHNVLWHTMSPLYRVLHFSHLDSTWKWPATDFLHSPGTTLTPFRIPPELLYSVMWTVVDTHTHSHTLPQQVLCPFYFLSLRQAWSELRFIELGNRLLLEPAFIWGMWDGHSERISVLCVVVAMTLCSCVKAFCQCGFL